MHLTEDRRRWLTPKLAYGTWFSALGLTLLRVIDVVPVDFGIIIVFLIGVAIASGLSMSRMKLASTIAEVFESGLKAATALQANVVAPACIVEVNFDGMITTVEHPEVIHWNRDTLIGLPLSVLIPDRFRHAHEEGFKRFRNSGETRVAGATMNVPVIGQDGQERGMRLSVARLGATFVGSLVPTGVPIDEPLTGDE